jgi:hypothetical protein
MRDQYAVNTFLIIANSRLLDEAPLKHVCCYFENKRLMVTGNIAIENVGYLAGTRDVLLRYFDFSYTDTVQLYDALIRRPSVKMKHAIMDNFVLKVNCVIMDAWTLPVPDINLTMIDF